MAFASNIAAMNAARATLKAQAIDPKLMKQFFSIEKHDGEWHSLQIAEFPKPREPWESLKLDRAGAFEFPIAGPDQSAGDAAANQAAFEDRKPDGTIWIRKSSILSPVKRVWAIADEMVKAAKDAGKPLPTRKEVQDECIRQGVASGTARTQYQAWKSANDRDAANAENAKRLSEAFAKRQS